MRRPSRRPWPRGRRSGRARRPPSGPAPRGRIGSSSSASTTSHFPGCSISRAARVFMRVSLDPIRPLERLELSTFASRSEASSSGLNPHSTRRSDAEDRRLGRSSRSAGVRLKRGAGPGWTTPSMSTKVPRLDVVRVPRGLGQLEHRGEAGVGALEQLAPLFERSGLEDRRQLRLAGRPGRRIGSVGPAARGPRPRMSSKRGVELRLATGNRHVALIGSLVDVVERRAEVEDVRAVDIGPQPFGPHPVEQRGEQRDTVHHCDVDHLALPRGRPLEQRPEDADRQQHAATAEVTRPG